MIYDALYDVLVRTGPLGNFGSISTDLASVPAHLFWNRLPDTQPSQFKIQVAAYPGPGSGSTKALGAQAYTDASLPSWLQNDGGILWYHTGLVFQARSSRKFENTLALTDVLDSVRDTLVQVSGDSKVFPDLTDQTTATYYQTDRFGRTVSPEVLHWAEVTNPPFLLEQEPEGRLVAQLLMEVWHTPHRT